jgi:hypothetical protein
LATLTFNQRRDSLDRSSELRVLGGFVAFCVAFGLGFLVSLESEAAGALLVWAVTPFQGWWLVRRGELFYAVQAKYLAYFIGDGLSDVYWRIGGPFSVVVGWGFLLSFVCGLVALALGASPGDWIGPDGSG